MIRTIIIDDEKMAVTELSFALESIPEVKVVGEYTDPLRALRDMRTLEIDLVMLDIEMPEINGFMLAEEILLLYPDIYIVFVTAYDEYAIKAFETNAIDYVLKPVSIERLKKSVNKVVNFRNKDNRLKDSISILNKQINESICKIIVWENESIILLRPEEILYFTSEGKDIIVVGEKKQYKAKYTLYYWEEKLLDKGFFRCHKGYLINLDKIEKIIPMFNNTYVIRLLNHPTEIPVSRSSSKKLKLILDI